MVFYKSMSGMPIQTALDLILVISSLILQVKLIKDLQEVQKHQVQVRNYTD